MSSLIDAIKADCRAVLEAGKQPPASEISEVTVPEVKTPNPEIESAEPGLFVWPRPGSEQEQRLQSRLQQLVLRQQSEQSALHSQTLQLEIELLKNFKLIKCSTWLMISAWLQKVHLVLAQSQNRLLKQTSVKFTNVTIL